MPIVLMAEDNEPIELRVCQVVVVSPSAGMAEEASFRNEFLDSLCWYLQRKALAIAGDAAPASNIIMKPDQNLVAG